MPIRVTLRVIFHCIDFWQPLINLKTAIKDQSKYIFLTLYNFYHKYLLLSTSVWVAES